jgi:hypothetical protein
VVNSSVEPKLIDAMRDPAESERQEFSGMGWDRNYGAQPRSITTLRGIAELGGAAEAYWNETGIVARVKDQFPYVCGLQKK